MFSDVVYKWLESALDYGITELEFWEMTIAELIRAVESKKRIMERQAREKAQFDYILADTIGRSMARLYSSSSHYPSIAEVYPSLFSVEDEQKKKEQLFAAKLKQFAQAHNAKLKGVANN